MIRIDNSAGLTSIHPGTMWPAMDSMLSLATLVIRDRNMTTSPGLTLMLGRSARWPLTCTWRCTTICRAAHTVRV